MQKVEDEMNMPASNVKLPYLCNDKCAGDPGCVKPKTLKLVFAAFSAKQAALRRKSKDWSAQSQNNLSGCSEFPADCCFPK